MTAKLPSTPDAADTARLLQRWFAMFLRIEATYANLKKSFGNIVECEVISTMYDLHGEYTKLVAENVGDDFGWLEWYLWDNEGGKRGLLAKAASWKKDRKIKTLKDLEALLKG